MTIKTALGYDAFCEVTGLVAYDGGAELGNSMMLYEEYLQVLVRQSDRRAGLVESHKKDSEEFQRESAIRACSDRWAASGYSQEVFRELHAELSSIEKGEIIYS